jgi:hypothetical protein
MGDKFEEWIKKQEFSFVYLMRNSPDYKSAVWRAWQASRNATIDEVVGMLRKWAETKKESLLPEYVLLMDAANRIGKLKGE